MAIIAKNSPFIEVRAKEKIVDDSDILVFSLVVNGKETNCKEVNRNGFNYQKFVMEFISLCLDGGYGYKGFSFPSQQTLDYLLSVQSKEQTIVACYNNEGDCVELRYNVIARKSFKRVSNNLIKSHGVLQLSGNNHAVYQNIA